MPQRPKSSTEAGLAGITRGSLGKAEKRAADLERAALCFGSHIPVLTPKPHFSFTSNKINLSRFSPSPPPLTIPCSPAHGMNPRHDSLGLTPGKVFCSCSAVWALMAESLAQYVRNAQPAVDTASVKLDVQLQMHIDTTLVTAGDQSTRTTDDALFQEPLSQRFCSGTEKCLGQALCKT